MSGDHKEFTKRLVHKEWPIYHFTPNRKKLRAGDKAIFYLAGQGWKKFVGNCIVNSRLKKKGGLDFSVDLTDTSVWKRKVDVHDVLADLDFVYNKNNWGCFFQGGVVSIDEKDYKLILSKTK